MATTVPVTVTGRVFVRLDGSDVEHELGTFDVPVDIRLDPDLTVTAELDPRAMGRHLSGLLRDAADTLDQPQP